MTRGAPACRLCSLRDAREALPLNPAISIATPVLSACLRWLLSDRRQTDRHVAACGLLRSVGCACPWGKKGTHRNVRVRSLINAPAVGIVC